MGHNMGAISGYGVSVFETRLIGFALLVLIVLLIIRTRRSHDLKRRKEGSLGFVAHLDHKSSTTSPSFVVSSRGASKKRRGSGPASRPSLPSPPATKRSEPTGGAPPRPAPPQVATTLPRLEQPAPPSG